MGLKIRKSKRKQIIDDIVLLIFYIAVFAYMPTARTTDRNIWIVALALLVIRTGINVLGSQKCILKADRSLRWYLIVLLWGALSCIWSYRTEQFELYVTLYFSVVLIAVICLGSFVTDAESIDRQMYIIMIAGVVAALRFLYYTPLTTIFSTGYYMRGTFGSLLDDVTNYNNYTTHICIICIIAAYYAIVREKKICFFPFLVLFAILVFGGSRKNIIVVPLIAVFFAFFSGNLTKRARNILAVVAVILIGVYLLFTLDFLEQIRNTMFEMVYGLFGINTGAAIRIDRSTSERLYLIEEAKKIWWQHPIIGVGWDNYRYFNSLHVYAHNSYYELLASLGVIGFVLYYCYYIRILFISFNHMRKRAGSNEDLFMSGILIAYMIQEYGAITVYGRERMIILLVVFLCYSFRRGKDYKYLRLWKMK